MAVPTDDHWGRFQHSGNKLHRKAAFQQARSMRNYIYLFVCLPPPQQWLYWPLEYNIGEIGSQTPNQSAHRAILWRTGVEWRQSGVGVNVGTPSLVVFFVKLVCCGPRKNANNLYSFSVRSCLASEHQETSHKVCTARIQHPMFSSCITMQQSLIWNRREQTSNSGNK